MATNPHLATPARPTMSRREKVRWVRAASRRRVRGREDVAPMPVQQAARRVDDVAHQGMARLRRMVAGDRGLLVGLAVMLVVAALLLAGPVQSFVDQRGRLELAQQQLGALEAANSELQVRSADLTNPEHVEVLAREQLGYARPGEIAYSLVPPEEVEPEVPAVQDDAQQSSWWSRLVQAFTD